MKDVSIAYLADRFENYECDGQMNLSDCLNLSTGELKNSNIRNKESDEYENDM